MQIISLRLRLRPRQYDLARKLSEETHNYVNPPSYQCVIGREEGRRGEGGVSSGGWWRQNTHTHQHQFNLREDDEAQLTLCMCVCI